MKCDYDVDDDGLIEVSNLAQLNAIRWDLNGDGAVDSSSSATDYATAFPNGATSPPMGCASGCTGYELAASLDFTGSSWAADPGWVPIGNSTRTFTATFDGGGPASTISNLRIYRPGVTQMGLFGETGTGSTIRNVTLLDVSVRGGDFTGALVGANRGMILGSSASGSVSGGSTVGGLVGWTNGPISDSHASSTVNGSASVGGLVGVSNGANSANAIVRSRASGDVHAAGYTAGGLVGWNNGPIRDSHAGGTVGGSGWVGGLIGSSVGAPITRSTASGAVTARVSNAGGLVAWNSGPITDCAARNPTVMGREYVGGLVGTNSTGNAHAIVRSTASAAVTGVPFGATGGAQYVGGLAGWSDSPISDSYATGAVSGRHFVGGLVGRNDGGSVTDSRAEGSVDALGNNVGGLVGWSNGAITGSVASGNVASTQNTVGGLVGRSGGRVNETAASGTVTGCTVVGGLVGYGSRTGQVTASQASGSVTAVGCPLSGTRRSVAKMVGGLVGWNDGVIRVSHASGAVAGVTSVGGLVGEDGGVIVASYAGGDVSGDNTDGNSDAVGGLVGFARRAFPGFGQVLGSTVRFSYASGLVSGSGTNVGGLVGYAQPSFSLTEPPPTFTSNFWDTTASGRSIGVGSDDADNSGALDGTEVAMFGVRGNTTTELQAPTGYTGPFASWNVDSGDTTTTPAVTEPWDFGGGTDYPTPRAPSDPPSYASGTVIRTVAEASAPRTTVGAPTTATDSNGDTLMYSLVGAYTAFFDIDASTGQLRTKAVLDYENPGDANSDNTYEVTVQATDGQLVAFRHVTIVVTSVGEPPVFAFVTASRSIPENSPTGTDIGAPVAATDPDTTSVTYSLSGPDSALFAIDTSTGQLRTQAALDFEHRRDYAVTVQASDGSGSAGVDVVITVTNGDDPGDVGLSSDQPQIGTALTASLFDPDGGTSGITWAWESSTDQTTWTAISAATAATYTPVAADSAAFLRVTATYNDALGSAKTASRAAASAVRAAPTGTNTAPAFPATETGTRSVAENTAPGVDIGLPVSAADTDSDDSDKLTYALSGSDAVSFAIASDTGQLRTRASLDAETKSSYSVTVTARDPSGDTDTQAVTITVTGVAEAPTVTGAFEIEYAENGSSTVATYTASDPEGGTITWLVTGTDSDDFAIDSNGALSFSTVPDFDAPADADRDNAYHVAVRASDTDSNLGFRNVTIFVTGVDEAPVVSGDAMHTLDENSYGAVGAYSAVDPEDEPVAWSLSGTDNDDFEISSQGVLRWSSRTPRDRESATDSHGDSVYEVTVRASDGIHTGTKAVTVTVSDVDEPPVVSGHREVGYPEYPARTVAGYSASDPEGETISWESVSGDDGSLFTITTGGEVTFKMEPDFENPSDADGDNVYDVVVRASDGDVRGALDISIEVEDVNETPTITGDESADYEENSPSLVVPASFSATDPEGRDIGWSVRGDDQSLFAISSSGVLSFKTQPDFESPTDTGENNVYDILIRATDGTNSPMHPFSVTVLNADEAGVITLSSREPQEGTPLSAALEDGDIVSGPIAWKWETSQDGVTSFFNILGAIADTYTPAGGTIGDYLRVTATYDDGEGMGKTAQVVSALPVRAKPVAPNVAPVYQPASVQRSVEENSDPGTSIGEPVAATDIDSLTYSLGGTDADSFAINAQTGQLLTKSALNRESRASYTVTVTATDPSGAQAMATVTITALDVDEEPVLTGDTVVDFPEGDRERTVARYSATEPDAGDHAISVSVIGPDGAHFFWMPQLPNYNLLFRRAPDFENPADADGNNVYEITVRARSFRQGPGTFMDATLDVKVHVSDVDEAAPVTNSAPTFAGSTTTRTVAENTAAGQNVGAAVTATDDDADLLTFTLSGTHASLFDIVATTGQLQTKEALNFETRRSYSVTISVSDGMDANGNTDDVIDDRITVTITVTNVNEPPEVTGETDISYAETRTNAVARYSASDQDAATSIEWSLSGADAASFAISNGVLTFAAPPDYETAAGAGPDNAYLITVVASDGSLEASLAVSVTVTDVNEPPTLSGPFSVFVPEHGGLSVTRYGATDPDRGARFAWILSGHDEDVFQISSDGELTFHTDPDFEHPLDRDHDNVYRLSVWVSDGRNTRSSEVFVTVTNIDEPGVISFSSLQPQIGTEINASLSDPDGRTTGLTWQWQSFDNGVWSDIDGATAADYTPVAAGEGKSLRVSAFYSDGEGSGKSAMAELRFPVQRPPASNAPPVFPGSESGQRSVLENTDAGTSIGDPIGADDPGDVLTYSLDPTGDVVFDIDPVSGQLLTERPLNYEDRSSYTVTVTATDPSLAAATVAVTIAVEDEDEPPMLSGATVVSVAEQSTGSVAVYVATDPEERDLIWSLGGRDRDAFALVDGVLSFVTPPDFDAPANLANSNTYELSIVVSDGAHDVPLGVTVLVTELDAAGPSIGGGTITGGGGGGGGGPSGPSPSTVDFEWTVKDDLETLDSANDAPTGVWSDGTTLWVADNPDGAGDGVYAYDLTSGERVEGLEFQLSERNRAPRGIWSDGTIIWVSDSGRDRLFAYDLNTGEPVEERDIELAERNRDVRDFWSDWQTMWVLDGIKDSLFAYDLETGDLLGEYPLGSRNSDPQGIWSDRVTIWISDAGASPRSLFAYRLPVPADEQGAEDEDDELERVRDEDFTELSNASNNSPRGIWSDGDVMYVADASDGKVYTYNMPDAIDARLASLSLTGVDIGEFDPSRTDYEGAAAEDVTETTVSAEALQRRTDVEINPPDADVAADGHQVALEGLTEITATVTSADGSRMKTYRVAFAVPPQAIALTPTWTSFEWPGTDGIALADALRDGGLGDRVLVIYEWDEAAQTWMGFFPGLEDVPGLNTLRSLRHGATYWVAVAEAVSWTIVRDGPSGGRTPGP